MKKTDSFKPWVEKYRPKSIENIASQEEVVAVLKKSFQNKDIPNLLFYGPPGTGKTSTILAMAHDLFDNLMGERVLELNASDERGIQVIREKVKTFSQVSVSATTTNKGNKCPALKLVILDEADSITSAAQSALRRIMEKESKTTRFCLICNYISRIIGPITSRCAKFRFKPLPHQVMKSKLEEICQKEEVEAEDQALDLIIKQSEGDMRKALTTLQTSSRVNVKGQISMETVIQVSGFLREEILKNILAACTPPLSSSSSSSPHLVIQKIVKNFLLEGESVGQLLTQLGDEVGGSPLFTDPQRARVFIKMAEVDKCLLDGADEYLQMFDLLTSIFSILSS